MGKEAKFVVRLSNEERGQLEYLVTRGRVAKATHQQAQVLLHADQGQKGFCAVDEVISGLVDSYPTADSRQAHAGPRGCRSGIHAKHRQMPH